MDYIALPQIRKQLLNLTSMLTFLSRFRNSLGYMLFLMIFFTKPIFLKLEKIASVYGSALLGGRFNQVVNSDKPAQR